ncbi:MAG: NAD(P)-dependent oxidoreductase [Candidatus Moranbacteria bacterium]|nr:NAD(P)-dependent oxidoreductase [Candidatus Moranbacteria bacterium]
MQKSILILGAHGMLGQEMVKCFQKDDNYDVLAWDKEECDLANEKELSEKITQAWPDIIINCAAYNAVDLCETDEQEWQRALMLNVQVPEKIAKIARELQTTFVHFSTDYVFGGQRPRNKHSRAEGCCGSGCAGCVYYGPEETIEYFDYREDDIPKPLSKYGISKLEGEEKVEKNCTAYYIIRVARLFGLPAKSKLGKKSFFDVIAQKAKNGEKLTIVEDEIANFTYAPDVAKEVHYMLSLDEDKAQYGVYHFVNENPASWYEASKILLKYLEIDRKQITPILSESLKRPAPRPSSSALINKKWRPLRPYEEALKEYIQENK